MRMTQLHVYTTDDMRLSCDDLTKCNELPFGPCIFGRDGSVSLYVNEIKKGDSKALEVTPTSDSFWGAKLTYIPVDQIRRIELRTQ